MTASYNPYAAASERIAARYVRRFGKGLDGQNVRDHAYRKVNRCITIRMIAGTKETRNTGHRELSRPITHNDILEYWR